MKTGRLRGVAKGLAAAVALGSAAAVPTVVALTENPQSLTSFPPPPGGGGSGGSAARLPGVRACEPIAAATEPWTLSRVLSEAFEQLRQLAADGPGSDEDDGSSDDDLVEAAEEEERLDAADAELALAADNEAAAKAGTVWQHQRPATKRSHKQRRGRSISATQLAAQHPEEVRHMRQLAAAELARLQAEAAATVAASEALMAAPPQPAQRFMRLRRNAAATDPAAADDSSTPVEAEIGAAAEPAQPPVGSTVAAGPAGGGGGGGGEAAVGSTGAADGASVSAAAAAAGTQGTQLQLPPRLTDAELMRFAVMYGFLRATTLEQREAALRDGAAAAARTACWLQQHPFSTEDELRQFGHLVSWQGVDAAGHPILHVSIGRAVSECRGGAALAFSNAIITLMEQGALQSLPGGWRSIATTTSSSSSSSSSSSGSSEDSPASETPAADVPYSGSSSTTSSRVGHGSGDTGSSTDSSSPNLSAGGNCGSNPDTSTSSTASTTISSSTASTTISSSPLRDPDMQIVVVMDCSGASALNAARISWVFQAVAATLSHHYPGRLHELVLVDLPVVLGWMVKGVKALVHPDTRHKFRVVRRGDGPPVTGPPVQQHESVPQLLSSPLTQQAPARQGRA